MSFRNQCTFAVMHRSDLGPSPWLRVHMAAFISLALVSFTTAFAGTGEMAPEQAFIDSLFHGEITLNQAELDSLTQVLLNNPVANSQVS